MLLKLKWSIVKNGLIADDNWLRTLESLYTTYSYRQYGVKNTNALFMFACARVGIQRSLVLL